ncbi:MAG: hypothetical protein KIT84_13890 [Labilithrix sp.]|nr:hypothetical protein [Labilithrix sp.]MCW5812111.1 hypothetical protein [Labilithrix sp.]
MKKLGVGLLAVCSGVVVACGGAEGGATSASESEVTVERGFEYECKTEQMIVSAETTKVLVTPKRLTFEDDYGTNIGVHDPTYRAPAGKRRVRYDGFETGMDCWLRVVADQDVVDGKPKGQVRIQCQGDDFMQEVLDCSNPKPATYRVPGPPPPPPPPVDATLPADARKWACTTSGGSAFADKLTMQINEDVIRIQEEGEDFDRTGERKHSYRPRSGDWIAYDNVEYGGDCAITLVVDAKVLASGTTSTTLKVRCAGDDFHEAQYTCK